MAENSKIEWTDHTFNPWVGCIKVSPACDHCYAESWAKRAGRADLWHGGAPQRTSEANWRKPVKWNADAAKAGMRTRVFCASLADVFDNAVPHEWRSDLFRLIRATPYLDWLLLTKRIGNAARMIDRALTDGHLRTSREPFWPWPNVWLGSTVVTQEEADRDIPKLLATPVAVRFLSCEPLLGPIDLGLSTGVRLADGTLWRGIKPLIDWVIVGGESGPKARPMHPDWARSLRDQCSGRAAFFMKQMTKKAEIPTDLLVREWPRCVTTCE